MSTKLHYASLVCLGLLGTIISPAMADNTVTITTGTEIKPECSFGGVKPFHEPIFKKIGNQNHDLYDSVHFEDAEAWLSCNSEGTIETVLSSDVPDHTVCGFDVSADLPPLSHQSLDLPCNADITASADFGAWDKFPSGLWYKVWIKTEDGRPLPAGDYKVSVTTTATAD